MGFGAGCVVVGPNVGNVGSILNKTGNPIFNPYDIDRVLPYLDSFSDAA